MPWPKRCAQCKLRIDWLKAIFYRAKHFVAHILLGRIAILCEEYLAQIRVKINLNPLIDCLFIPECPPMHAISTGLIPDRCTFFIMVCMTNGYNQKFCIAVFLRHCLKSKMSNCSKTYEYDGWQHGERESKMYSMLPSLKQLQLWEEEKISLKN